MPRDCEVTRLRACSLCFSLQVEQVNHPGLTCLQRLRENLDACRICEHNSLSNKFMPFWQPICTTRTSITYSQSFQKAVLPSSCTQYARVLAPTDAFSQPRISNSTTLIFLVTLHFGNIVMECLSLSRRLDVSDSNNEITKMFSILSF